jgi:hypothetical protein
MSVLRYRQCISVCIIHSIHADTYRYHLLYLYVSQNRYYVSSSILVKRKDLLRKVLVGPAAGGAPRSMRLGADHAESLMAK